MKRTFWVGVWPYFQKFWGEFCGDANSQNRHCSKQSILQNYPCGRLSIARGSGGFQIQKKLKKKENSAYRILQKIWENKKAMGWNRQRPIAIIGFGIYKWVWVISILFNWENGWKRILIHSKKHLCPSELLRLNHRSVPQCSFWKSF